MKWHLRENELPEENRLVIIYVPNRPWAWNGKGDIHYKIAWLKRGISLSERKKLSDNNRRKREFFAYDEGSNNQVPYCWDTFGLDRFFGQEVLAWSYFDEYKGEQK